MSEFGFQRISRVDIVATERLYLTSDRKIVKEGDKEAASLLCSKGDVIPAFLVKELGIDKLADKPNETKEPKDPGEKQTRVEKPTTR